MAKCQGPLHSDHAKGSMSGITFREYRGLATATRRPRPVRRTTRPMSSIQAILSHLARHWNDLSAADRELWRVYSQNHPVPNGFGGTFQLDGNQMFIRLNSNAIRLGGAAGEEPQPPVVDSPANVDTLIGAETLVLGEIQLDWTHLGTPDALHFNEVQFAGPFDSPGRVSVGSRFRYIEAVAGDLLTDTLDGMQPLAWYWFRVRYVTAAGQVTNWLNTQAQTTVVV